MRTEMVTVEGYVLIVKTSIAFLGNGKLIKKIWFLDAECNSITNEK
jgi:hypothetical protein